VALQKGFSSVLMWVWCERGREMPRIAAPKKGSCPFSNTIRSIMVHAARARIGQVAAPLSVLTVIGTILNVTPRVDDLPILLFRIICVVVALFCGATIVFELWRAAKAPYDSVAYTHPDEESRNAETSQKKAVKPPRKPVIQNPTDRAS
jgi:hypothetical protein